jgi:hypothetical protein
MASASAYSLIKAEVVAAVAPLEVLDFEQIDPDQPQSDAIWIAIEEDFASDALRTIGCPTSATVQETGGMTLHLFIPGPDGLADGRTLADSIRSALRWKTLADGVQIGDIDPAVPGLLNSGAWSSLEIILDYTRNINATLN